GSQKAAGGQAAAGDRMPAVAVCAVVASAEAARVAVRAGATRVYATAEALATGSWPADVVPILDEVCREVDHDRLDPWVRPGEPVAVGNVSELALAHARGALPEVRSCVPVHNESCVVALAQAGAAGIWLSAEMSLEEIEQLAPSVQVPVGVTVMGRTRAMTTEHCVLQVADKCVHACATCKLRAKKTYLRNGSGELYPVRTDAQGRSRVYAARPLDATPQIPELVRAGVRRLAVDGTLMDDDELAEAIRRVSRAIAACKAGIRPSKRMQGCTSGHLFEPIE
ncbi:MAG: U32 family peptidase, partial [Atopobiaceae bacterium]|nr:U32 family peptidase [Atopobiaceae bacterium]